MRELLISLVARLNIDTCEQGRPEWGPTTKMASTLVSDLDSLFGVGSVGPGRGKKGMNSSTHAPRKRKSAMKDFSTEEEYKKFAKSRNAATKR